MRLLITGATGFIGGHLLRELNLNSEFQIVATMRPGNSTRPYMTSKNIQWLLVDYRFKEKLIELGRFDAILHLATCYGKGLETFTDVEAANVAFPLLLLDFAIKGGADIFINTDSFFSRDIYKYVHMQEYVISKQNFLKWGIIAAEKNKNLRFINARLEHVYGPFDRPDKFVPSLIEALVGNKSEINLTSCEQERDFIYVADAVNAFVKIIINGLAFKGFNEIEIGSGNAIALKNFVHKLKYYSKSNSKLIFGSLPQRSGEIMSSRANIKTLKSLGWLAKINIDDGINLLLSKY